MSSWLTRTSLLLGDQAIERLKGARVCVFGMGAVGSYAVEGLARAGVGTLRLVDFDVIREGNINRQLFALRSTLGVAKVRAAAARIRDINPDCQVEAMETFAHVESLPELLGGNPDIILDAVDSVAPKVEILTAAVRLGLPILSSMGAATRLDPNRIFGGDLFQAKGCPLASAIRKRLRRKAITSGIWCVYSEEPVRKNAVLPPPTNDHESEEDKEYERGRKRSTLGSLSTVTGIFGLRLAHEAILRLSQVAS